MNRLATLAKVVVHALFWPWNLAFICIVAFGYVPVVLVDLVADAAAGLARWDFVAGSFVLVLLPIVVTIQSLRRLRRSASDLALVFFGAELPVFFFVAARLFGFQDLSGAARLVIVCLMLGGLATLARVLLGERVASSTLARLLFHGLLALLVVAGGYVGFLLATLTVPLFLDGVLEVLKGIAAALGNIGDWSPRFSFAGLGALVTGVVGALFAVVPAIWILLTLLVLLALPVAAPVTWVRLLVRSTRVLAAHSGSVVAAAATAGPIVVVVGVFALLWQQPHEQPLARLRALEAHSTASDADRQALLDDRDDLQRGLVDAYLARLRYLDAAESMKSRRNAWAHTWEPLVGDGDVAVSTFIGALARPFLYQGDEHKDAVDAERLYLAFFGSHLERDHAGEVRAALSATWSREQRYAGFINSGEQRVRLVRQDLTSTVDAGVATVEIHDEWTNLTVTDEEVALFFELPESAAVTGLWLSPSGKKEEAFAFVVAPRGAAQQVYREQVQQRRDPALIEQVGPRQYRLRVFPVPARHVDRDRTRNLFATPDGWFNIEDQPRQHVWLRYEALVDGDGTVPLPRLRERRNGFWDDETVRFVNGASVAAAAPPDVISADDDEAVDAPGGWVQARLTGPPTAQLSGVADGQCIGFRRAPSPTPSLAGQNVDVVVDRSLSMAPHRGLLKMALSRLADSGAGRRVMLGTSALRHEPPVVVDGFEAHQADGLQFFGAASVNDLLRQALEARPPSASVPSEAPPSAIVILTGPGSFDVATDEALPIPADATRPKIVVVHLGGALPAGYDDGTIDAIRRSGGSAVANIDEALARLSGTPWVDGLLIERCDPTTTKATGAGHKMIARQLILDADRAAGGARPDVATLDRLHALARTAGVVTPYSSMIVLVDEAQRARLKQLEAERDRFDREIEDGAELPPQNGNLFDVSGVPEPHEWLLLLLAGVAVVVMVRRAPTAQSARAASSRRW